jgi:ClpP class serine protease
MSLISAGKYKLEGNPWESLTAEARAAIQTSVDEYYDAFIKSIARNRGMKPASVRNGFGEGRLVGARQAVELGMADRVGTLEETIDRLLNQNPGMQANGQAGQVTDSPLPDVNVPEAAVSSEPRLTEDMQREAQTLRDRVQTILRKELPNA